MRYPHRMARDTLLLGYDIGSSSVKATLLDPAGAKVLAAAVSPDTELPIASPHPGWAEQHPDLWWEHLRLATTRLSAAVGRRMADISAVGIAYQMHGLVIVDRGGNVLRPSIIWCDSRAVEIGERAFNALGPARCLERLLNSPGNFTASKLRWVRENEPEIYRSIHRALLPGDYIAYRMTGRLTTTPSGLSEGILWDFPADAKAGFLLDHYDIDPGLFPEPAPTFSPQGTLTSEAASELGLPAGAVVSYRAGDQPNNALSLNALEPGEIAATAGTSGVVYGVTDVANHDPRSRVNTFVHVNHGPGRRRYGILVCVNGTGILWSWMRRLLGAAGSVGYPAMNEIAARAPVGSDGLVVLPFGNGAERTLDNRDTGAVVRNLRFPRHGPEHVLRACIEGVVFSLRHGLDIMRGMGMEPRAVRAGNANLFLSPLFASAFATTTGAAVELYDTDGSQGAARGAGVGAGVYRDLVEAFQGLVSVRAVEPSSDTRDAYADAYSRWSEALGRELL
jgi:xylulokinase